VLAKCANPFCPTPFRHFREGKLFRLERKSRQSARDSSAFRPRWFWLSGQCAANLTVKMGEEGTVAVSAVDGWVQRDHTGRPLVGPERTSEESALNYHCWHVFVPGVQAGSSMGIGSMDRSIPSKGWLRLDYLYAPLELSLTQ